MSILVQDFGGIHNSSPDKTSARLLRGGSWAKQRICVVLPAADMIPAKVALSHWNLAFPPNNGVCRLLALGMEVGDAYSKAIADILAHPDLSQWEYILTLEHDNTPPGDGVLRLCEDMEKHPEFSAIGGLYFTKGEGGVAQIWGDPKDQVMNFRPQVPGSGIQECCGTGMGFTLFRMKMFKDQQLRKPWFQTQVKDGLATQDLFFWSDARKYGYRCAIDCDVRVGHYDMAGDMVW